MSAQDESKTKQEEGMELIADEMESEMETREATRRGEEQAEWEDLNVGATQTGTYDVKHPGINWGPSYRTRRKRTKANQRPKDQR